MRRHWNAGERRICNFRRWKLWFLMKRGWKGPRESETFKVKYHLLSQKNMFYHLTDGSALNNGPVVSRQMHRRGLTCSLSFSSVSSSCTRADSWAFFCFSSLASLHWASSSAIWREKLCMKKCLLWKVKQCGQQDFRTYSQFFGPSCVRLFVFVES